HRRKSTLHITDHVQRGGVGAFGHWNVNRALFVHLRITDYHIIAVCHSSDVSQVYRRARSQPHGLVEQFIDISAQGRVCVRDADEVASSDVSRRQDGGCTANGGDDLVWRKPILPQLIWIDLNHDRSLITAEWRWRRNTGERCEYGPNTI